MMHMLLTIKHNLNIIASLLFLLLLLESLDVDDVLHLVEVLVDVVHLSVQQFGQFLDLRLPVDGLLAFEVLLALEMEGPVDGEPVQLATLVLVEHVPFNTGQVSQFALLDVYQKLHIIPYHMILLLMLLEPIFLPVQDVPLNPANEAETVLILL